MVPATSSSGARPSWPRAPKRSARGFTRRWSRPLERGLPYNGAIAERAYRDYLNAFIVAAMRDRPVFVTGNFDALSAQWHRVPFHLAMKLTPDTAYVAEPSWEYHHRSWDGRVDGYVSMTSELYGEARAGRAAYEAHYGREILARELLVSIAAFDPRIRVEHVARCRCARTISCCAARGSSMRRASSCGWRSLRAPAELRTRPRKLRSRVKER